MFTVEELKKIFSDYVTPSMFACANTNDVKMGINVTNQTVTVSFEETGVSPVYISLSDIVFQDTLSGFLKSVKDIIISIANHRELAKCQRESTVSNIAATVKRHLG